MPITNIEINREINFLSILDENGDIDKKLDPKLDDKSLKDAFYYMLLARRFDERLLALQRQGRIGTFPQASGHEAISMGSIMAIQKADFHVPAYRELVGMLYRGMTLETMLLYWMGYEEGAQIPEGVNDLPACVPVASQLLHATGIAMAMKLKKEKNVVLTYIGDGATSEGDFHEALNFASVFNAPVIFICLNNQYAISVPLAKQMKAKTVAQKAIAYDIPGIRVDGNDVLAVYKATTDAVARARNGDGPSLIECLTYRITPHTTADDPKKYRSVDESSKWLNKEPLIRLEKYLIDKKILTKTAKEEMEELIENQIKQAILRAPEIIKERDLDNPERIFNYLYKEMPANLIEQKQELLANLTVNKEVNLAHNH